jgi:O-antigen ligase
MPYILATAIAAIALILAPGASFSFDIVPKLIVLLTAAALAPFPARRSRLLYLAALTLAWLAISTACSTRPELSFFGSEWRRYGALAQIAVVVLAWSISSLAGRVDVFLRVVTAAGVLTALYGIAQYLGWDPILPAASYHIGEGIWTIVRPPSTLGYASYFATWLLFVIFWSLALPGKLPRICLALAVVALALTGTRAAVVGLVAGAAVWTIWRGTRPSRRTLALGLAVLAAGAVFYFSPMGQAMRSRTRWFREDPWGGARLLLWRDSLDAGLSRPLLGFGPETFSATFPYFESKELARQYPDFSYESPHNIFLDALHSQGLPGLLLLLAWCGMGLTAAWQIRAKYPEVSAGLAAALVAGIVAQQFTVFTIPTAVIFFATVALAEGLRSDAAPPRRYLPFGLPLLYFAVRMAIQDRALVLTQRALAAGNLSAAENEYAQSHEANDLWYSRSLATLAGRTTSFPVRIQTMQQAFAAGQQATRTAEAPFDAWYSLSELRASQNDFSGTEQCLRSAIAARPSWFKPHWTLARVLYAEGRKDEARREGLLALDLDNSKHSEVSDSLHEIILP